MIDLSRDHQYPQHYPLDMHTTLMQQGGTATHPTAVPANASGPPPRRSTRRRSSNVTPARTMATAMATPPVLPDLDTMSWKTGVEALKQTGNAHYATANYLGAIDAYLRALDVVHANMPYGHADEVTQARIVLHNNMAAAFLELGMFNLALREAEVSCALDSSGQNVKGLLRRGKALYGMADLLTAELMFRRVLEVATVGYASERTDAQAYLDAITGGVDGVVPAHTIGRSADDDDAHSIGSTSMQE